MRRPVAFVAAVEAEVAEAEAEVAVVEAEEVEVAVVGINKTPLLVS